MGADVKGVRERKPPPEGGGPRRVLMTADAVGGVWSYALELARGLAGYGVEVILAVMGTPPTADQLREVRGIRNIALHRKPFALEWMEDPWDDVDRAGRWLLELADELGPDLVHLNGYVHAALPWKCPCVVVAHSCLYSWWDAVRQGVTPEKYRRYRDAVRRGLSCASVVAAPSGAMLSSLERFYLPLGKTRVIHNGRSRRRFKPGCKENFVLSVGRLWDEAKNVDAVMKSAGTVPWPVYVAGPEGHPEGGLVPLQNVNRLGQLSPKRLASWFARASIYAHPARYEPFGLTILEAAMSRCALVLGDIPSLRELWKDAALFVPPDDTEALAAQLRLLCEDRERREQMAQKAFARSLDFSPAKMAAQYLDAYGTALQ
ncbi:glycosyltransferase family 4 protein [Geomonas sp. Red875]|uniref:Glycosyltransferase family 4 protein n=2 Tax=Geomesophilobacter sediminis TaxID=2798584 RepID=A0A8J7JF78_9BACT|nr:glycosyltransferase family 4 protein [Geomesophilobacter sediminis]